MSAPRHFLDLSELEAAHLRAILDAAATRKAARQARTRGRADDDAPLAGFVAGLLFAQPSTRTRVSFDTAMRQLGGGALALSANELQMGRGETNADTARVLSRMVDCIVLRTPQHHDLLELAAAASVPVLNALTSFSHPCQIVADVLTFEEHKGAIGGRKLAWLGSAANNMATSWAQAAMLLGFELHIAAPPAYALDEKVQAWAGARANKSQGRVVFHDTAAAAADGAAALMTDCWVSMGDAPSDAKARARALLPYQVNAELMARGDDAIFLHCLPAYRGQEVSAEVMDAPQSVVWEEAENRVHAQKAILLWCLQ